jgi:hypothetical protein
VRGGMEWRHAETVAASRPGREAFAHPAAHRALGAVMEQ